MATDVFSKLNGRANRRTFLAGLGAAAVGFSFSRTGFAAEEKKLNFYNWDTYIGETTLDTFKDKAGIGVNMSLFATNDELFAKLRAGNPGYDVIVPGSEFVERMVQADLLVPLDHSKIPNIKNVAPEFISDAPYDPGRKFSLPYTWLVIGIGYRKSKVKEKPDSWKVLFDSDQYKGRISVMSDASELYRHVFKYLGESANKPTPELIRRAEAILKKQKPFIKAFHEDNGQDLLLSGEVDVVMEYNGDIAQIMSEDDDIDFIVPKEGALKQSDTLAIPKGAPHPENAHAFINFLLDAEVGKEIFETIKFPSPNAAATAIMPDDYKTNPVIFPPADLVAKCEYPQYAGTEITRLLDESLTRLRAD
ncbi:spermidine/putrescine ABC transporter substrate-binding protein [Hyphomicrobium sp.]|uniref:ABC transporter substrate-binding protein n=1 Tax=Hyphomicrobium sp. TaxID=82 RepID=UPI002E32D4A3|nr:spermidine/putrescine ABC transporter substrate-binding protein [Hyphomicrobium sp.]HEX2842808.1 spermidine/putrescine ABC transporter substrate-binding protein [Hyphomicrobium sp.]